MSAQGMRLASWALALMVAASGLAQAQTTVKYVHTDALGSVVAMTDATGAVVETTREYEPYGQQLTPAVQDGPGYTGHVQDAATGLTYMQQRYYDSQIGRFLSADPVSASIGTGFNRFSYAGNNPYSFIDPDGRCRRKTSQGTCPGTDGASYVGESMTGVDVRRKVDLEAIEAGRNKPEVGFGDPAPLTKGPVGTKAEANGVQLEYRLKRYVEPNEVADVVNARRNSSWGLEDPRFIYTEVAGWIDFKHVEAAGRIPLGAVAGKFWEWTQRGGRFSYSSGAAEDNNSNVLGANARMWQSGAPRPAGMTDNFGTNVQVLTRSLVPLTYEEALRRLGGE